MKKIIAVVVLLTGGSPVDAMENTQEVPSGKEGSHYAEEALVKIYLTDSQNADTTQATIPVRFAKCMEVLAVGLEDPELLDAGFFLPNVTITIWRFIEPQLERVYGITHDEVHAAQLRQEIITEFCKLDGESLIGVMCAADYVQIPILLESAYEALKQHSLDEILYEEKLEFLPRDTRNSLIMNYVLVLLGPVPARELVVCRGHSDTVTSAFVTKDGTIVSGSEDTSVRIWDMEGNQLALWNHEDRVGSVWVTKDGTIVSGSEDTSVRVWAMEGNQLALWGHEDRVSSICVMKDEGRIISASWDKTIRMWDMQGKELAICRGHEGEVTSVCVTKDDRIVSGSNDKTVRVWDMEGKELAVCRGHEDEVNGVCVTNDGRIVSGSYDNTVRVWDMEGSQLALCTGHSEQVRSVWVTIDSKIVSGSEDGTIRVWDMEGNQLAQCSGHSDGVRSVYVTKKGRIVSGSEDGTVRVWDMQGTQLALCRGHSDGVRSVCVMQENRIISGSWDNTVRIWDMQGNQLALCRGHGGAVRSVSVTIDGKIVSAYDTTLRVWDLSLLDYMVRMDDNQAQLLWDLLRRISKQTEIDKRKLWKEIEKILEDDAPVPPAKINNNNNE